MKAVILAGGDDTRLRPLTHGISKLLLPVAGKPVIDYVLDNVLKCKEIDEVLIATSPMGHHEAPVKAYLQNTRDSIDYRFVPTLGWGSGGDLKVAVSEHDLKEPFLVAYGDVVSDVDVSRLIKAHDKNSNATVALFEVPFKEVGRFGAVQLEGEVIRKFVEKPKPAEAPSNVVHACYFVLDPNALEAIPQRKFMIESVGFPQWAEQGKLKGLKCTPSMWVDIGTLHSYMKANRMAEVLMPPE